MGRKRVFWWCRVPGCKYSAPCSTLDEGDREHDVFCATAAQGTKTRKPFHNRTARDAHEKAAHLEADEGHVRTLIAGARELDDLFHHFTAGTLTQLRAGAAQRAKQASPEAAAEALAAGRLAERSVHQQCCARLLPLLHNILLGRADAADGVGSPVGYRRLLARARHAAAVARRAAANAGVDVGALALAGADDTFGGFDDFFSGTGEGDAPRAMRGGGGGDAAATAALKAAASGVLGRPGDALLRGPRARDLADNSGTDDDGEGSIDEGGGGGGGGDGPGGASAVNSGGEKFWPYTHGMALPKTDPLYREYTHNGGYATAMEASNAAKLDELDAAIEASEAALVRERRAVAERRRALATLRERRQFHDWALRHPERRRKHTARLRGDAEATVGKLLTTLRGEMAEAKAGGTRNRARTGSGAGAAAKADRLRRAAERVEWIEETYFKGGGQRGPRSRYPALPAKSPVKGHHGHAGHKKGHKHHAAPPTGGKGGGRHHRRKTKQQAAPKKGGEDDDDDELVILDDDDD